MNSLLNQNCKKKWNIFNLNIGKYIFLAIKKITKKSCIINLFLLLLFMQEKKLISRKKLLSKEPKDKFKLYFY